MTHRISKEDLHLIKKENLRWPKHLIRIDPKDWPLEHHTNQIIGEELIEVFRSREFLVQLFRQGGKQLRLSIQRTDWDVKKNRYQDGLTWDQLQQLKKEVGYGEFCAAEVYPPDSLVVNVANIRHLFLYPKGQYPDFVWTTNLFSS